MAKNKNKNKEFRKSGSTNKPCKPEESKFEGRGKPAESSEKKMPRFASYESNTSNDIRWWNKNKINFDLVTRIPFIKLAGRAYNKYRYGEAVPTLQGDPVAFMDNKESLPLLMRIFYTPGIGVCEQANDAPNMAFSNMYSTLSSTNSRALPFPKHILATHVICLQSVAQNIALVKRALSTSNMWSALNLAFPRGILRALGIDPDTVMDFKDEITVRLNNIINQFNTLKVPATIDIFERHYSLCHNIWADQDDVRAQFYAFMPTLYYVYGDLGAKDGSGQFNGVNTAIPVAFNWYRTGELMDIQEVMDIIQVQLNAIINSDDFNNIQGYILRSFDANNLLRIDNVTKEYTHGVARDEVMAMQIHNLTVGGDLAFSSRNYPEYGMPLVYTVDGCAITGDPVTNLVKYRPKVYPVRRNPSDYAAVMPGIVDSNQGYILNFFDAKYQADNDMIMEATRLISTWYYTGGWRYAQHIGTEFVNDVTIYKLTLDENGEYETNGYELPPYYFIYTDEEGRYEWGTDPMVTITDLSKFHQAPRFPIYRITAFNTDSGREWEIVPQGTTGDLMYWTTISADNMESLHSEALLSVFNSTQNVPVRTAR